MPEVTNKGVQKLEMTKGGGGLRMSLFTFFSQKSSNVPIFSLFSRSAAMYPFWVLQVNVPILQV